MTPSVIHSTYFSHGAVGPQTDHPLAPGREAVADWRDPKSNYIPITLLSNRETVRSLSTPHGENHNQILPKMQNPTGTATDR